MSKLISVFPNTDLRSGHPGLQVKAAKADVDVTEINPGELVLFINKKQTAFKAFAHNNTLIYYKHQRGMLNLEAIKYLPTCLNGSELNYDRALAKVFERLFPKKRKIVRK